MKIALVPSGSIGRAPLLVACPGGAASETGMIQLSIQVVAPPGKSEEILEGFRGLRGPTEVTSGCRACRVFRDTEDDRVTAFWSQWNSQQELEEYFRSERFRRLLPYIELSVEPPEVKVCDVTPIGGIEILVAAIGSQSN